jgi:hypothetical protein
MLKIFNWQKNFFLILGIIFILIVIIPFSFGVSILGLSEKTFNLIFTIFLLIFSYGLSFFYLREYKRLRDYQVNLEERLQDTFKYIGSVNLQMEEMKRSFSNFKKYPESKKDIKTVFSYFSEKILSMINAEWVILRIIDTDSLKTLREEKFFRNNKKTDINKFDNADILQGKCGDNECSIAKSDQEGFYIKTFCILPIDLKNSDQEFFIKSMINQLEMLFIVFSAIGKKNNKKKNNNF